jgi:cell wall-associated NlpC family hydrolase
VFAQQIISTGLQYLGTPYLFNSPSYQTDTFDCSSFIQYIYRINGIHLPRNSRQQFLVGVPISFKHIKKGDLLFFTTKTRKNRQGVSRIGHVAIYIGQGRMLHTYSRGKKVRISEIDSSWMNSFIGARRVMGRVK